MKLSTVLICYFFSISTSFIGLRWLKEYQAYGYYTDFKNRIVVEGPSGLYTIYAVLGGGIALGLYSLYLTWRLYKQPYSP